MQAMRLFVIFIAVLFLAAGCGLPEGLESASLDDVQLTNEYKGVVKVISNSDTSLCTGTFIAENVVVTAAHCVDHAARVITQWGVYNSYQVISNGPGTLGDARDIAILIFDEPIADPSLGQVYNVTAGINSGEKAILVGAGCNSQVDRSGTGLMRAGTNLARLSADKMFVEFFTPFRSTQSVRSLLGPSNRAGTCAGDSGGPALVRRNGRLAVGALAHSAQVASTYQYSRHSTLSLSENLQFLTNMKAQYNLHIQIE